MKQRLITFMLVTALGVMLTACGDGNSNKNPEVSPSPTPTATTETSSPPESANPEHDKDNDGAEAMSTQEMVDAILAKVEQPSLMDMPEDMIKDMYHMDTAILEQSTVRMPMMNVKTNEVAIFKVKDAKDIPAVEEGIKQRAEGVQKQFETYLQDQYENAKNYKVVLKDNYVFFVISEDADKLVDEFNALFK